MKYKLLSSLYYEDLGVHDKEFEKRINSAGTVLLPIKIHENQSFILPDWEIASLIESIGTNNATAQSIFTRLPGIAQRYYVTRCLIEEIQTTNEIEGVHSTRKEIKNAIDADEGNIKQKRFQGLAKKYVMLLPWEKLDIPLATCADIRMLYDNIVSEEINDGDKLDGEIFRKGTVFVVSKTQQKRHEGVMPETKIIKEMEQALKLLEDKKLSVLVRIALFHYFFGYIHPFYDGNGRVSRFISSTLLKKNHFPLLAFDLSHTIKENRNKYYEAFRICNNRLNKGDTTSFVIAFLELIHEASERMRKYLDEGLRRLDRFSDFIDSRVHSEDKNREKKKTMLFFLIQKALFGYEPFNAEELQNEMACSRTSMEKIVKALIEDGYPVKKEKVGRYNQYSLDIELFENMMEKSFE